MSTEYRLIVDCRHDKSDYAEWLRVLHGKINGVDELSEQRKTELAQDSICFRAPPISLVETYADVLIEDEENDNKAMKGGAVRCHMVHIAGTCEEFGAVSPLADGQVYKELKALSKRDSSESGSFDMVADFPKLWVANWTVPQRSMLKKIKCWVQFLLSMIINARPSEVTQFCPLQEDTLLPEEHMHDADGYPMFLDLGMRDWKGRTEEFQGERYSIRAWRNRVDSRFCPVFWLMIWWSATGYDGGPIFQKMNGSKMTGKPDCPRIWRNLFMGLVTHAGYFKAAHTDDQGRLVKKKGVTPHGIRKTAIQWAARCKGQLMDIVCNSRHKTVQEMLGYFNQGARRRSALTEHGGTDPIWSLWVWKPVQVPSDDGTCRM